MDAAPQEDAFSYKDAKNWVKKYPECYGKHQSPVIIDARMKVVEHIDEQLTPTNFNKTPKKMTIKNTGHTVELKADWTGEPPKIKGGPLVGNYVFDKITFHWAQKEWSEGIGVNDEPTMIEMEMHLFFYKEDLKSFENAQSKKDGLAAFKVSFKTGLGDHDDDLFGNLEKNLRKVQSQNSTAAIDTPDPHI
ncbi:carbonic anhydrase 1-like [Belonocnema kinseyi]|uniref:carbonic anhydrase 1-like n=1 Tax=Belonocnema kinseyi TaxID=2817044 RepID=UPI00143DF344|nr:carbonic anhydrase 1-like [Belonocnema kinseyi]